MKFGVSRETMLAEFGALLLAEASRQNLISKSTENDLWARHLADSAQLVALSDREGAGHGTWTDIGSGAGLPGMVAAILSEREVHLIEPRTKRVAFLNDAAETLGIARRVQVHGAKAERVTLDPGAVISARAVANLASLFGVSCHLAASETLWLLPKGRSAKSEVEAAREAWQGSFHVEQSITDAEAGIVIARGVAKR